MKKEESQMTMLPGQQQMMQPDQPQQTMDTHSSQINLTKKNDNEIPAECVEKAGEKQPTCCCCISIRCGLHWMIFIESLEFLFSMNLISQVWNFNWDEQLQLIAGITMLILAISYIMFGLYIQLKFFLYLCKTRKAGTDTFNLRLHVREGMKAMLLKKLVAFICRLILMFTLADYIYRFETMEYTNKYSDFPNTIGGILLVNWWRSDIEKWMSTKIKS